MRRVVAIGLLLFSIPYYHGNALATTALTLKGLEVHTSSPVEFVLTDPQGRRTGFDPITKTSFHEIPVSDYSTTKTCDELNGSSCSPLFKSLVMANPMDGLYTLDVIGTARGDFRVEVRVSDATGDDLSQTYAGTTAHGVRSRFTFPGTVTFFAAFGAKLKITSASNTFEVNGTFTLGPGATISPVTQPLSIQLGNYFLVTIPPGSFRKTPQGAFVFTGVINGMTRCTMIAFSRSGECLRRETEPSKSFDANLTPTGVNGYTFRIMCAGPTGLPSVNPVEVHLAIGSNGGMVSVNADIARQRIP